MHGLTEAQVPQSPTAYDHEPECVEDVFSAPPQLHLVPTQRAGAAHGSYRGHLLILDNDVEAREMLAVFLRRRSFRVWEAATASEAQAMLAHRMPDLLLLDIALPLSSGTELIRALRRHRATTLLPIIIVSAYRSARDIRNGLALGADDYITKPVELGLVEARINALLRREARMRLAFAGEEWAETTMAAAMN